jgi:hypothetical protein
MAKRIKKTTTTTVVTEEIVNDNQAYTVYLLVDESGSMGSRVKPTLSAINEYVDSLKTQFPNKRVRLSFLTFASSGYYTFGVVKERIINRPLNEFPKITEEHYFPSGGTPLYDAIGDTISKIGTPDENVIFVIITDGEENSSYRYTSSQIKSTLETKQAANRKDPWLVVYLGSNQDAWEVGSAFGVQKQFSMTYNDVTFDCASRGLIGSTSRYMSTGNIGTAAFTEKERLSAVGK